MLVAHTGAPVPPETGACLFHSCVVAFSTSWTALSSGLGEGASGADGGEKLVVTGVGFDGAAEYILRFAATLPSGEHAEVDSLPATASNVTAILFVAPAWRFAAAVTSVSLRVSVGNATREVPTLVFFFFYSRAWS